MAILRFAGVSGYGALAPLALTLLGACASGHGAGVAAGFGAAPSVVSSSASGPTLPPSEAARSATAAAPEAPAPEADRLAAALLEGYDLARQRLHVTPQGDGFTARACGGQVTAAQIYGAPEGASTAELLARDGDWVPVAVVARPGAGWAAGKRLVWVIVGNDPGLYGFDQGVLALVAADDTVELCGAWSNAWASSPQTPFEPTYRFVAVGSNELLLEGQISSGEEGGEVGSYRVWRRAPAAGAPGRWRYLPDVSIVTHYLDLNPGGPTALYPGYQTVMTSTLSVTPEGLRVDEDWSFESARGKKTRRVARRYLVTEGGVTVPDPSYPKP